MDNEEMAAAFREWNRGELESFLVEVTAAVLAKKDTEENGGGYVVDKVPCRLSNPEWFC